MVLIVKGFSMKPKKSTSISLVGNLSSLSYRFRSLFFGFIATRQIPRFFVKNRGI